MRSYTVETDLAHYETSDVHGMNLAEYTLEYQDPAEFIHEYLHFIKHGGARLPATVSLQDSNNFRLWIKPPMLSEPIGMHASVTSTDHGTCFVKLKPLSDREQLILESYVHGYASGQNWLAHRLS